MAFFEALGVPVKVERGRRVYPVSDRAFDVSAALELIISGETTVDGAKIKTAKAVILLRNPDSTGFEPSARVAADAAVGS